MKRIWCIVTLLAGCAVLSAAEPHIKNQEKEYALDGVQIRENDRSIQLDTARLIYLTKSEKDKKALRTGKWGEFFFGLEFGRPVRSNGGWSIWNFIEIFYWKNQRYNNAVAQYWPENVTLTRFPDRTMLDITTRLDDDRAAGALNIRLFQFKSHPNWVFVRANFESSSFTPWRINLNAYPGNSNESKERERWAATRENQYNLSSAPAEFKPVSPGIILFSKFVHEDFGNMIVFNPDEFEKIVFPKAGASVSTHLFPKKGVSEFHFALSYFLEKPLSDVMPRFLNEDADHISTFLRGIDWNPTPDSDAFDKAADEVAATLQGMKSRGTDVGAMEKELAFIRAEYKAAVERKDPAAGASMEKLEKMKKQTAGAGLDSFK
jgi:hypothetical protein